MFKSTEIYLYTDILNESIKRKLFIIVLGQLEILILDLIELDLKPKNIELLSYKILYDLIQKIFINFLQTLYKYDGSLKFTNKVKSYFLNFIVSEYKLLLENLLVYLIFGSGSIKSNTYAFDSQKTPVKHVSILLDNFIIQTSNLVVSSLFESINSLSDLVYFLQKYNISNSLYISTRSVAVLVNNLVWQNFIYSYIQQPKDIYSSRYRVWVMNHKSLKMKYIYMSRLNCIQRLSKVRYIIICFMELQDLLVPKLEKSLLILGKISIYIFINIIGNGLIFIVRAIVSSLYSNYK